MTEWEASLRDALQSVFALLDKFAGRLSQSEDEDVRWAAGFLASDVREARAACGASAPAAVTGEDPS